MSPNRRGRPRHPGALTPAEQRVLGALREGGTNAAIGARLGISADAVKYHISNMLGKLGLRDRRELAAWRPDARGRRLGALLALPALLWPPTRTLAWVAAGTAAAAGVGVAVVAIAGVVLVVLAVAGGDGEEPSAGISPRAVSAMAPAPATTTVAPRAAWPKPPSTPSPTPTPSPSPTPAPTSTPTPSPAATPAPRSVTLTYDTYDTTGAVTEAGSYAFLGGEDGTSVVTTYEALRDGTTTALLIHTSDADEASQSGVYDDVETGDIFEWKQADDCFVRYTVTSTPQPAAGTAAREFGVEWMTYAYTGCSGAISADAEVGMTWGNMRDLGGLDLRAPVVHGTHHLVPSTWEGETEATTRHEPDTPPRQEETGASTLAEVRALHLPYWREPTLPEGWILERAWEGGLNAPWKGFCSVYLTEPLQFPDAKERQEGMEICGAYNTVRKSAQEAFFYADQGASPGGLIVRETRVIAGRPAVIVWSPPGTNYLWNADVRIYIDDLETESSYSITVAAPHRSDLAADGNARLEKAIALATSLFESEPGLPHAAALAPTPSPAPRSVTLRYDTYDTTGAVTEAGSYAFLGGEDGASVVTTYEALRDGTVTSLRIHTSDADGASQSGVYDDVQAGDMFEWKTADDCFVRYTVTSTPQPAVGAVAREFGAEWMTYAYTGCSGVIDATASSSALISWVLPDIKSPDVTSPIHHGHYVLVPLGWWSRIDATDRLRVPSPEPTVRPPSNGTLDIAEARKYPLWREPALPDGWVFRSAQTATLDAPDYGFTAYYGNTEVHEAVEIVVGHLMQTPEHVVALSGRELIRELRVIDGHPAVIKYTPVENRRPGLGLPTSVMILDRDAQIEYYVRGFDESLRGSNIDATIEIARSLLQPSDRP